MRYFRLLLVLFTCSAFVLARLHAQTQPASTPATPTQAPVANAANPTTPAEFFARARQLSDLEAAGVPFHLKAAYVATGDAEFTGNGTYEEWWQSKEAWRKEATLGNFRYVAMKTGNEDPKIYTSLAYVPWHLREVLNDVLIRIPANTGVARKWKIQRKTINKAELIVLSQKNPWAPGACGRSDETGQNTQMCLQQGDFPLQGYFTPAGVLRIQVRNATTAVYNGIQPFQNLLIPRIIVVADSNNTNGFPISIQLLEPLSTAKEANSTLAAVPADLQPLDEKFNLTPERLRDGVKPPSVSFQVPPRIPESIRMRHQSIQKSVVVEVIVDEKGNVRKPRVIQSAGAKLDDAALTAVCQYKFKPATYRGNPVAVKIDIVIAFHVYGH